MSDERPDVPDLFGNLLRAGRGAMREVAASDQARELFSLVSEGGQLAEEQLVAALRRLGVPSREEFEALQQEVRFLRTKLQGEADTEQGDAGGGA